MSLCLRKIFGAAWCCVLLASPAAAQALRCSGFIHMRDGAWRSLDDGPILGPHGTVNVASGEILQPTDRGEKGDLARALNGLCEGL